MSTGDSKDANGNLTASGDYLPNTSGVYHQQYFTAQNDVSYWISTALHLTSLPPCLFGNVLVLVVLIKQKKLRTKPNLFVLSLALADILMGLAVVPMRVAEVVREHESSLSFCNVHKFCVTFSLGCSLLALLLISFDRYLAVAHPFLYVAKMTKRVIRCIIVVTWLSMLIICIPIITLAPAEEKAADLYQTCNPSGVQPRDYAFSLYGILLLMFTCNAALYAWVAKVAIRQRKRINEETVQHGGDLSRSTIDNGAHRGTRITIIMFGAFTALWAPYMVVLLLHLLRKCPKTDQACRQACQLTFSLGMVNSGFNCFIYAWQKQDIGQAIKRLLCRKVRRHRISSVSPIVHQRASVRSSRNSLFTVLSKTSSPGTELTMVASVARPSMPDMRRSDWSCDRLSEVESTETLSYFSPRDGRAISDVRQGPRNSNGTVFQTISEIIGADPGEDYNEDDQPITMVAREKPD